MTGHHERDATEAERGKWGTCPVCCATDGRRCRDDPVMYLPDGTKFYEVHKARFDAAPKRVALVAANALDIDALVNRFLTWPVPASVCPDGTPGQPGRTGTNLLTAEEARAMLLHVMNLGAESGDDKYMQGYADGARDAFTT